MLVIISSMLWLSSFSQNPSLAGSVVSVSCSYTIAANSSLSWSVGEAVTGIMTSPGHILTVGFQQNWERIVGIKDIAQDRQSAVYPNPADGKVFIRYHGKLPSELVIEVYDLRGAKVGSERKNISSDNEIIAIDVSDLRTGMYLLRLSGSGNKTGRVYKLIKN